MLNSKATRALLCSLICCAPALAIIPPEVTIRIGGADMIGPNHFAVAELAIVGVEVKHKPGDVIWLFAVARDRNGEADYSKVLTLFLDKCPEGRMYGEYKMPKGTAGSSFEIQAMTLGQGGEIHSSTNVVFDVVQDPILKDGSKPSASEPNDKAVDALAFTEP
jgi:hypothetical protein